MRRPQVDNNQKEIVAALRKAGRQVVILSAVGKGVPDLLVSNPDEMWLMEVKNLNVKDHKHEFTPAQHEFMALWRGKPILTVYTPEQAIEATK